MRRARPRGEPDRRPDQLARREQDHGTVAVSWRSPHSATVLGFNVYRQDGATRTRLNKHLIVDSGNGTSYRYADRLSPTKATKYWVQAIGLDGSRTWLGSVTASRALS